MLNRFRIRHLPNALSAVLEFAVVSVLLLAFAAHAVQAKLQTPGTMPVPRFQGGPAGKPYVKPLVAIGGTPPYTWTALAPLPSWESLSPDGVLTGLPMQPSTAQLRLQWTDSSGVTYPTTYSVSQTVTPADPVTVNASPLLTAPGQAVQVTATVRDANGNPVPGAPISFFASGSAHLAGPGGAALPATTDANGNAAAQVSDGQAEDVEVTGESGGLIGSTDVAFTTDATRRTFMNIDDIFELSTTAPYSLGAAGGAEPPALVPADGVSQALIGVRVLDENGHSLPGVPVVFQTTLGNLSSTTGTTDAQGQVVVDLTSTQSGGAVVTATVPGLPRINAANHNQVGIDFVAPSTTPSPTPTAGCATVNYAAGWNLAGGPTGAVLTGAAGSLFSLPAGATAYQSLPVSTPLTGGGGVWAYFPGSTTVTLPCVPSVPGGQQVALPANQFLLVGNPDDVPVNVSGADTVFIFNPATNQYATATTLAPGQGALVFSRAGGVLTLTPTAP